MTASTVATEQAAEADSAELLSQHADSMPVAPSPSTRPRLQTSPAMQLPPNPAAARPLLSVAPIWRSGHVWISCVGSRCRLGVDECDSYAQLHEFVKGLSPHQNRTVPPLRHQWAWALARDFPHLQFSLNGGLQTCHDARAALLTAHPEVPYTRPRLPHPGDPRAVAAAVCATATPTFTPLAIPPSLPPSSSSPAPAPSSTTGTGTEAQPAASTSNGSSQSPAGNGGGGVEGGHGSSQFPAGNGGGLEGVMIGRGAYNDPWGCLADADRCLWGDDSNAAPNRRCGSKRWKAAVDEVLKANPATFGEVLDKTLHLIPDELPELELAQQSNSASVMAGLFEPGPAGFRRQQTMRQDALPVSHALCCC
eukprot:XP_001700634.1 predicted protein [Chlamydomonas reinhardtii]